MEPNGFVTAPTDNGPPKHVGPCMITLRVSKKERARVHDQAHEARCSMNVFVRRKLGLPDHPPAVSPI